MLKLTRKITAEAIPFDSLTLTYDSRIKSRLLAQTDDGIEVGLFLPRGTVLHDGDLLASEDGQVILIKAAQESVSVARTNDSCLFAKACYHLGNRHVPLAIQPGDLMYLRDHVLDQLVEHLGLTVEHQMLPFDPEPGAYHAH